MPVVFALGTVYFAVSWEVHAKLPHIPGNIAQSSELQGPLELELSTPTLSLSFFSFVFEEQK